MRIELVPSAVAVHTQPEPQFLSSFLVDDALVIDAGSIGLVAGLDGRSPIHHVLITHSHIDHVASLPLLVEALWNRTEGLLHIHGSKAVLESLQRDIFNGRLWPDVSAILDDQGRPAARFELFPPGTTKILDSWRVTAVAVDHVVPTVGLIVEGRSSAAVFSSDTGPTDELWQRAKAIANLRAAFIEVTFPNDLAELATVSKHLTPERFAKEIQKLPAGLPIYAVHLKPKYAARVADEIAALGFPNVAICQPGRIYDLETIHGKGSGS